MKSKKLIPIIAGGAAVVTIAVVLVLVLAHKSGYRLLKIFEVDGDACVTRDSVGDIDPYANMVLESGDQVALDTGKLTIQADEDKYIYLEENTKLVLKASGNSEDSKTMIELLSGAITNDIQNPLSPDSSYEVNTPNSTMSVRGTIYRVQVYEENGVKYTKVSVFAGKVETRLVYKDGTLDTKAVAVEGGKEAIIYEDGKTTDYLVENQDIVYEDLPPEFLEILLELTGEGRELSITGEEIEELLKGPFTVKFMYNGSEFGSQEVKRGDKVSVPTLQPAETGKWDFDFSTPIKKNTTIEWK